MRSDGDGAFGCLGDAVAEIVVALIACGLLGLVGFGLVRAPILTAAIVVPIIAFGSYGAWLLIDAQRRNQRAIGRLWIAATATAVVVRGLLTYIGYCGCIG